MSNIPKIVTEILTEIGLTVKGSTWDCHGTTVMLHKSLERVAAHKGIVFDTPTIVESQISQKNVAICVTGHLGNKSEWSFGEAAPYNNKNSYPYAMAEKRAKDRVILKLVGLHGHVYSEDEADAFERPEGIQAVPQDDPSTISPEQAKEIVDLMIETKTAKESFCAHFKIDNVALMPVDKFTTAINMLQAKRQKLDGME
jgi:hypothetical protein